MERRDVDTRIGQRRAEPANEAGLVLVGYIQHVTVEIGLDLNAFHLHQAGAGPGEQRARDRTYAPLRRDGEAHQRLVLARPVMHGFGHVQATLPRQHRGVDHIDPGHHRRQQAGQQRRRERFVVQRRDMALILDPHRGHDAVRRLRQLPGERAQVLAQLHVRFQPGRILGRDGRHIDCIGHRAGEQEVAHLLGHLQSHVFLRLGRGGTQMRRANDVLQRKKRAGDRRLRFEHIERRTCHLPGRKRLRQGRFVDQATAGAVDDANAALAGRQRLTRQNVARGVGQWRVQCDDVGTGQQIAQFDLFDTQRHRARRGQERVVGDHTHAQPHSALGDDRSDITAADQP